MWRLVFFNSLFIPRFPAEICRPFCKILMVLSIARTYAFVTIACDRVSRRIRLFKIYIAAQFERPQTSASHYRLHLARCLRKRVINEQELAANGTLSGVPSQAWCIWSRPYVWRSHYCWKHVFGIFSFAGFCSFHLIFPVWEKPWRSDEQKSLGAETRAASY